MNAPKDKIGQPVIVGAFIAYGHALGRCAGLRIGRVLALAETPPGYMRPDPSWKATVIGIEDDWSSRPPELCTKTGTLFFPDRWLVLDPRTLPDAYHKLFLTFVWPPAKKARK